MADETPRKPHTKRQIDKVLGNIAITDADWQKVLSPRKRADKPKPEVSDDTEQKKAS